MGRKKKESTSSDSDSSSDSSGSSSAGSSSSDSDSSASSVDRKAAAPRKRKQSKTKEKEEKKPVPDAKAVKDVKVKEEPKSRSPSPAAAAAAAVDRSKAVSEKVVNLKSEPEKEPDISKEPSAKRPREESPPRRRQRSPPREEDRSRRRRSPSPIRKRERSSPERRRPSPARRTPPRRSPPRRRPISPSERRRPGSPGERRRRSVSRERERKREPEPDTREQRRRSPVDERSHRENPRQRQRREDPEWERDQRERRENERKREERKRLDGPPVNPLQEGEAKFAWGLETKKETPAEEEKPIEKEKPNFGTSGALAEDTNTFNGVVIKYNEPPEARKPKIRWRLYPFKGDDTLPVLYIHRQSAFLVGRDRRVADLPVDHPSCSKQHAVFQYRSISYKREDGSKGRRIRPYIIDLGSGNGTFLNNERIEPQRYVELKEKDVIKFGFSSREYVLLNENTQESDEDDMSEGD